MSTGYQIKDQSLAYFITLQVVEWVDTFSRKSYRDIIIENLAYCQKNKNLTIFSYVIMSNHVHLLVRSETGELSNTLRDFKSYTSKKILEEIKNSNESRKDWMLKVFKSAARNHVRNSEYQFWTHENHAEYVYSNKFIDQKLEYIHQNPVRAGIVNKAEDYIYSSAKNYADEPGLLEVCVISKSWTILK